MKHRALSSLSTAIVLAAIFGCSHNNDDKAIARVFGNYLYESDIQTIVPPDTPTDDSAAIVANYIQQWIQEMVVLEKAKNNINDNFEKELQNYKNSLITYNYERLIVEQQLDTNVPDTTIQNYYNKHREVFTLKNNILRAIYIKIPVKSKNAAKIRNLMSGNDLSDKNIVEIERLSANEAVAYNYDQSQWITFLDFQHIIPVKTYNEEFYLKNTKNIFFTDNEFAYIAKIFESKIADELSPIEFEYQNIKNIILNKRKVEIVDKMRSSLITKAENDNEIEIFKK